MSRPDHRWFFARVLAVLACGASTYACSIPYPITVGSGPLVVPPSPGREPLGSGARVTVVSVVPAGCQFLGLATGVGGAEASDGSGSPKRDALIRDRAVVALRNAVADAGGTHATLDAEAAFTSDGPAINDVVVRGGAFVCR